MINGTFYYDFSIFVEDEAASSTLLVRTRVSSLLEGTGEQGPGSEHGVVGDCASSDHAVDGGNWQPDAVEIAARSIGPDAVILHKFSGSLQTEYAKPKPINAKIRIRTSNRAENLLKCRPPAARLWAG